MKRTLVLIITVLLIQTGITIAQKSDNSWLKNHTTLAYVVKIPSASYDFIVEGLMIGESISFGWRMSEPANLKGFVTISKDALDTATSQMNNFEGGASNLTNQTTVWMCKNVYRAIKSGRSVTIDAGEGKTLLTFKKAETYTATIDGKETKLNALYAETTKGYKYWILDDSQNPVILKMDLGWSLELKTAATK